MDPIRMIESVSMLRDGGTLEITQVGFKEPNIFINKEYTEIYFYENGVRMVVVSQKDINDFILALERFIERKAESLEYKLKLVSKIKQHFKK